MDELPKELLFEKEKSLDNEINAEAEKFKISSELAAKKMEQLHLLDMDPVNSNMVHIDINNEIDILNREYE